MLYNTEFWVVKKQHVHKMRMLRWINGNTRRDRI